jgi:TnpA family transposase
VRLYRPAAGDPGGYPRLAPALTGPIRWDLIDANYHQVIKYATAIREIGRAQRTIFVARYLRDRDLQREIEEGLNVAEAWNGANAVICYDRGGEIRPTGGKSWR